MKPLSVHTEQFLYPRQRYGQAKDTNAKISAITYHMTRQEATISDNCLDA